MIFDIEQIREEGTNLNVLEPKEHFGIDSSECVLTADVKVQGKLVKTDLEILFKGSLNTELSVACSRCLSDFICVVKSVLRVHFIPRSENNSMANEIELTELDVEQEYYEGGQIDLSNAARDLILLSLPQVILCQQDCLGLCPDCGINLNNNKCECKNEGSFDPRFSILQKLKDKLK